MPKDALTIYRGAGELGFLVGGRVDKVTMPDKDTMILLFHTSAHGNHRLLLSCDPSLPRAHITTFSYKNPEVASGMLMYFRKRLVGAVLVGIDRARSERMLTLRFSALNELRERVAYSLAVELTGKCANIIFIEDGVIGNCLRRISAEIEGKRAVFPGLRYAVPNATGRVDIFDGEELKARATALTGMSARAAVNKCIAGLAMTTVDEIFSRLGTGDGPVSAEAVDAFIEQAAAMYETPLEPTVTYDESGKPLDYFIIPYSTCGGEARSYPTLNAAMDAYYTALFSAADMAAYAKPLRAAVRSGIAKNKKRLADASAKLEASENCDTDRLFGELITANIYRLKRGLTSAELENFYDENKPITVPLDPTKTPQANAAAYFKTYSKKKKGASYARAAIDAANDALFTLESIAAELDLCTEKPELDEVRAELIGLGLIRPEKKKKTARPVRSVPYSFDACGATVLIGKNHAQNDVITREAGRGETWLHVKDAHGCHAVLKTTSPTDEQIVRAAELAAYYSQARDADKVAVDYTLVKYVYPHGGGHVDYKEYKTVIVSPRP